MISLHPKPQLATPIGNTVLSAATGDGCIVQLSNPEPFGCRNALEAMREALKRRRKDEPKRIHVGDPDGKR